MIAVSLPLLAGQLGRERLTGEPGSVHPQRRDAAEQRALCERRHEGLKSEIS